MNRTASGGWAIQASRALPSGSSVPARFTESGLKGLAGIVGLFVLAGIWYAAAAIATPDVVPWPHTVIACLIDWFHVAPMLAAVGLSASGFGPNLAYTIENVLIAVAIGSAIGVVIGLTSARSPMFRAILNPIVSGATAVPFLVMAPFFLVWFGVGRMSGVLLVTLYTSVILIIFSQRAVLNLDPVFEENATTLGASRSRILRNILIPATVPEILGGLRIALAGAWGLETVAELLGSSIGIGVMIRVLTSQADTIGIMAAVVAISTVAVLADAALYLAARRVLRWKQR
jgi:ABC-type nitrate/sulfonate/bicarbonate transport system permease component